MKTIKRREFLKTGLIAGGAVMISRHLSGSGISLDWQMQYKTPAAGEVPDIVTISGADPEVSVPGLLEPLGGIAGFVKPGQTVGLLVNSPWKNPGYFTQPDIVMVVADLCLKAGAKEIICLHTAKQDYWERGKLYSKYKPVVDGFKYGTERTMADIPGGVSLKKAEVFRELLDVDVFISIPVAKHHAGCIFSGNLKGMMGASSSATNRNMHSPSGDYTYDEEEYLAQCIADLNLIRKPDLCIVDATVCALNNGPAGPGETMKPGKIIAGKDPLALDAYSANLIGFVPDDVLTFKRAYEHGLGEMEPGKLKLLEL
jgi:uncharacterized protein (DUF362 family)